MAGRWHGDDPGLRAKGADCWWGEWKVTGVGPSGSLMTCGQLTLSQLIRLLFPACLLFPPPTPLPPSPCGSHFCLWATRQPFAPVPFVVVLFSPHACFTPLFSSCLFCFFLLSRFFDSSLDWTVFHFNSALLGDWKNEAIPVSPSIIQVSACLSLSHCPPSPGELVSEGNSFLYGDNVNKLWTQTRAEKLSVATGVFLLKEKKRTSEYACVQSALQCQKLSALLEVPGGLAGSLRGPDIWRTGLWWPLKLQQSQSLSHFYSSLHFLFFSP